MDRSGRSTNGPPPRPHASLTDLTRNLPVGHGLQANAKEGHERVGSRASVVLSQQQPRQSQGGQEGGLQKRWAPVPRPPPQAAGPAFKGGTTQHTSTCTVPTIPSVPARGERRTRLSQEARRKEAAAAGGQTAGGTAGPTEGKGKETDSSGEGEDEDEDEDYDEEFEEYASPPSPRTALRGRLKDMRGRESNLSLFGVEDPYNWTDGGERDVVWRNTNEHFLLGADDVGTIGGTPASTQRSLTRANSTTTSAVKRTTNHATSLASEAFYSSSKFVENERKESGASSKSSSSNSVASGSATKHHHLTPASSTALLSHSLNMQPGRLTVLRRLMGPQPEKASLSRIKSSLLDRLSNSGQAQAAEDERKAQQQLLLALEKAEKVVDEQNSTKGGGTLITQPEGVSAAGRRGKDMSCEAAVARGELALERQNDDSRLLGGMEDILEMLNDDEFKTLMQQAEEMCASTRSSGDTSFSSISTASPSCTEAPRFSPSLPSSLAFSAIPTASLVPSLDTSLSREPPRDKPANESAPGLLLPNVVDAPAPDSETKERPREVEREEVKETKKEKEKKKMEEEEERCIAAEEEQHRAVDDAGVHGTQQKPILIDEDEEKEDARRSKWKGRNRDREVAETYSQVARNSMSLDRFASSQPGRLSLRKRGSGGSRENLLQTTLCLERKKEARGGEGEEEERKEANESRESLRRKNRKSGEEPQRRQVVDEMEVEARAEACGEKQAPVEEEVKAIKVETLTKITLMEDIQIVEQSKKIIMEGLRELEKEAFLDDMDRNWWPSQEQPTMATQPYERRSEAKGKEKDVEEKEQECEEESEMDIVLDDCLPPGFEDARNAEALALESEFTAEMFDLAMLQVPEPPPADNAPTMTTRKKRKLYERFLVLEVSVVEYETPGEYCVIIGNEKVLRLFDEVHSAEKFAQLRGPWVCTEVHPGEYVHVIGQFDSNNKCVVDGDENLLILHPDILVTGTTVGESYFCMRKSILNNKAKTSNYAMPLIKGTILHDSFETALGSNDFSTEALSATIQEKISTKLADIYAVGETDITAKKNLEVAIPNMQNWAQRFLHAQPKTEIKFMNGRQKVCVSKVLAIEENIWSPAFGLKGKIDASVEMKVDRSGRAEHLALPLELKTGKLSPYNIGHQAQVILYTLLMSDRYDTDIRSGLLYYVESGDMMAIQIARQELVAIIQRRNDIAAHLVQKTLRLPGMKKSNACRSCHQLRTCTLYHKALENGNAESSGIDKFDQLTGHLTAGHMNYFSHWDRLIDLEEAEMYRNREEIWLMSGEEREAKTGRCFNDMVVDKRMDSEKGFLYCFKRASVREAEREREQRGGVASAGSRPRSSSSAAPPAASSLLDLAISTGDYVVISTVAGDFAVASGFVKELTSTCVYIQMSEELRPPPIPVSGDDGELAGSQMFRGIVEIEDLVPDVQNKRPRSNNANVPRYGAEKHKSSPGSQAAPGATLFDVRWRLDKEELSTGFSLVKQNLLRLFVHEGDQKRRRLVVDLEPPSFLSAQALSQSLSQRSLRKGEVKLEPRPQLDAKKLGLNADQQLAIEKILQAEDYALILGMPGTGKTTTIAHVVRALVAYGKSVLITAYTHTAVDNLLLKLLDMGEEFLRLGKPESVDSRIQPYVFHNGKAPGGKAVASVKEVETIFQSARIVATTCLSINNPLFEKRRFDYCIVDEASQLTLPVCLGPIRFSDVFVLVGDHYQLPPLVLNAEAKELGMGVSLFKRLSEAHPQSVVNLEYQYRMNADIMKLCNHLTYSHRLRCGNQEVARRSLRDQLTHLERLPEPLVYGVRVAESGGESPLKGHEPSGDGSLREKEALSALHWLREVLDPERSVVFLNTDSVPALESRAGDEAAGGGVLSNQIEAELVCQITDGLLLCGLDPADLGIISPYRAQVKLIRSLMAKINDVTGDATEIHTVDKYQGRDKDCIIVSLVRSNAEKKVGELLCDWRRVNVAFTRAKKKLIILGSLSTLENNHLFSIFLQLLRDQNWIYALPRDAGQVYGPGSHFVRWWRRENHPRTQQTASSFSSSSTTPRWASPSVHSRKRPPASSSSSSSASSKPTCPVSRGGRD